ncbi:MAG: hypothetical protein ACUVXD_03835 [Thermodesulfobacteriota bacterium]
MEDVEDRLGGLIDDLGDSREVTHSLRTEGIVPRPSVAMDVERCVGCAAVLFMRGERPILIGPSP